MTHATPFLDFESLRLSAKPNQYLVAPPGLCARTRTHATAPVLLAEAPVAFTVLRDVVRALPRTAVLAEDESAGAIEAVQRSALFRFPDFVSARIVPLEGGRSSLALFSRSTYGYSDLGVNKARVGAILAAMGERLRAG